MSTAAEAAWLAAEAEAYAAEHDRPPDTAVDAWHETFDALAQASLAIGNRWPYSAQVHLETARLAAAVAFPAGSERARSLLAVIGAVEAEASAAGLLESAA